MKTYPYVQHKWLEVYSLKETNMINLLKKKNVAQKEIVSKARKKKRRH